MQDYCSWLVLPVELFEMLIATWRVWQCVAWCCALQFVAVYCSRTCITYIYRDTRDSLRDTRDVVIIETFVANNGSVEVRNIYRKRERQTYLYHKRHSQEI